MDPVQQNPQLLVSQAKTTHSHMAHMVQLIIFGIVMLLVGFAGGYLFFAPKSNVSPNKQAAQIAPTVMQVTPSISHAISPTNGVNQIFNDTANWKTYTSKTNLFSFKYPSTWKEDRNEPGEEVILTAPPSPECAPPHACGGVLDGVSVSVYNNPTSLSIQDFIKKDPYNMYNLSHFVKNSVSLGIPADWVIDRNSPGAGSQQEEVLIPKGTKVIDLGFNGLSDQQVNQILSTFNFTN